MRDRMPHTLHKTPRFGHPPNRRVGARAAVSTRGPFSQARPSPDFGLALQTLRYVGLIMRNFFIRLFVNALALSAAAWLVPGIALEGSFGSVVFVALVFGLVNATIKPLLLLLSLPLLLVTLGLFTLVVNAGLLLLTSGLTAGLYVSGFGAALVGGIIVSIVSVLLGGLLDDDD